MRNGNYVREKREMILERFTTHEGLFEFFTATAIWYFLVRKYIEEWYQIIFERWVSVMPIDILAEYVTYLSLSIIFTLIMFALSVVLVKGYNIIRRNI